MGDLYIGQHVNLIFLRWMLFRTMVGGSLVETKEHHQHRVFVLKKKSSLSISL